MQRRSATWASTKLSAPRSRPSGIVTSFPIQALTLPLAIDGQDIIGQARTGTGKTLAFGIPMLHRLATTFAADRTAKAPSALVVVPTRELAVQVAEDIQPGRAPPGSPCAHRYGGRAYEPQLDGLKGRHRHRGRHPGTTARPRETARTWTSARSAPSSLTRQTRCSTSASCRTSSDCFRLTPDDRQTMLFSATMPGEVVTLARRHMRRPTNIRAEEPDESAPPPLTRQHVYRTHQLDRIEVLARLLQAKDRGLSMVFCQTKRAADQVSAAPRRPRVRGRDRAR